MAHWAANTRVRFVPRAANDTDFVRFVPSTDSRSPVGKRGGRQDIELSNAAPVGTVIHEMGHALGLWHEQSRQDRNSMVTINFANIPDADEHNFAQHITDGDDIGGYDFGSIMHYSATAFSSNNQPTIVPKVPLPPGVVMGQRNGLSFGDRAAIHALYGGWFPDWFPLPGQHVFDHEKQQIAAVSRAPEQPGSVCDRLRQPRLDHFWNGQGLERRLVPAARPAVFDREKQQIAAVSRAPSNLDLFVIGFDNHVWTTSGTPPGWNGDWFPLPGQAVFDRHKQQIAAVSRPPGNLDLFVIGFDNHVWTTFWTRAGGWNGDWFPLPGQAVFDRQKQQHRRGLAGPKATSICLSSASTTTSGPRSGTPPEAGTATGSRCPARQCSTARNSSRGGLAGTGNLDLFVIGFDNHVWTTFWNAAEAGTATGSRCPARQCSTATSSSRRGVAGRTGTSTCSSSASTTTSGRTSGTRRLERRLVPAAGPGRVRPREAADRGGVAGHGTWICSSSVSTTGRTPNSGTDTLLAAENLAERALAAAKGESPAAVARSATRRRLLRLRTRRRI